MRRDDLPPTDMHSGTSKSQPMARRTPITSKTSKTANGASQKKTKPKHLHFAPAQQASRRPSRSSTVVCTYMRYPPGFLRDARVSLPPLACRTSRHFALSATSAWSVINRRASSRHCKDERINGHTTTAMHDRHDVSTPTPLTCSVMHSVSTSSVSKPYPAATKSLTNRTFAILNLSSIWARRRVDESTDRWVDVSMGGRMGWWTDERSDRHTYERADRSMDGRGVRSFCSFIP